MGFTLTTYAVASALDHPNTFWKFQNVLANLNDIVAKYLGLLST